MKPPHEQPPSWACAVCCDLAADGLVRVGLESLPELRRQPGPFVGEPLPTSFLKHADEQTVVGLTAVRQAVHSARLQPQALRDWGVVAAPRFLGRPAMAAALQRFQAEGAWGVSPHLIPHRSLHSISGTVSQALKIHGPNFGVGGGPGGPAEALLAAVAMLEGQKLPGVLVVLTCLDPEQPPEESGRPAVGTQCVGAALALTPPRASRRGIRLRVICGEAAPESPFRPGAPSGFDLIRLESLLGRLHGDRCGDITVAQVLGPGSRMEWSRTGTAEGLDRLARRVADRDLTSDSDRGHFVMADY